MKESNENIKDKLEALKMDIANLSVEELEKLEHYIDVRKGHLREVERRSNMNEHIEEKDVEEVDIVEKLDS